MREQTQLGFAMQFNLSNSKFPTSKTLNFQSKNAEKTEKSENQNLKNPKTSQTSKNLPHKKCTSLIVNFTNL